MKYLKFFENFTQTQIEGVESTEIEDVESTESNPDEKKIYILIGPPAVGKSTWIENNLGREKMMEVREVERDS